MLLFAGTRFNYRISITRIVIEAKPVFLAYNDLLDLRKEAVDIPQSIIFSTINEAWEYILEFKDLGVILDLKVYKEFIPNWILITPRYIHPELVELICKDINLIRDQISEDRLKRLIIWGIYLNREF